MSQSEVVENLLPPRKEHTAAYKIFHYDFECRIAEMHLNSEECLRMTGTLTTGNAAWDRALATQLRDVRLTIAAMAEYVAEGATFSITKPEDSAKIYRLIKEHLDEWMVHTQNSLHALDVPTDDLRKLDQLAGYVYPHARYFLKDKPFHGELANLLARISQRRGGLSRTKIALDAAALSQPVVDSMPKVHTPLADMIASNALERRKSWDSKTPR